MPLAFVNTLVLIFSSVTIVMSWASLRLNTVGACLRDRGAYAEAVTAYERSLELAENHGVKGRFVARTMRGLAVSLARDGRHADARRLLDRAYEIYSAEQAFLGPDQKRSWAFEIERWRFDTAELAWAMRDIDDAYALCTTVLDAFARFEGRPEPSSAYLTRVHRLLAAIAVARADAQDARRHVERALTLARGSSNVNEVPLTRCVTFARVVSS